MTRWQANKFGAKRTIVDGIQFHSKKEAQRWSDLRNLERAGMIHNLERQKPFPIVINGAPVKIRSARYPNGRAMKYVADFVYFEGDKRVIEDAKGRDTSESRIKRALIEAIYNIEILVT